jgi:hypothetical protein
MNRYLFFVLLSIIFLSCKKENSSEFVPDANNSYNDTTWMQTIPVNAAVNELFQILSPAPQTKSFDVAAGAAFSFDNNVEITFSPNSPSTTTSGDANVAVDHLALKGDIIRFGKSTTSGNKLLVSAGAFRINVAQNGSTLEIANDKTVRIKFPALKPDNAMKIFYGDTSVNSREGFTWIESSDSIKLMKDPGGADTGYFYEMISKKFEWVSCDRFYNYRGEQTKVSVFLPVNFTNKNTAVFLVSKNEFITARCRADYMHRLFYIENIPVGETFKIVTVSKIDNDLYWGIKEANITKDIIIKVSPEKKTAADIITYLSNL